MDESEHYARLRRATRLEDWVWRRLYHFVQGEFHDPNLFVFLPVDPLRLLGTDNDAKMRLNKSSCGLNDAPCGGQLTTEKRMRDIGFIPHVLDPLRKLRRHRCDRRHRVYIL